MKIGVKKSGNINTLGNKIMYPVQLGDKFQQRTINQSVKSAKDSNIYENKSNHEDVKYLPTGLLKLHHKFKGKSYLEK